MTAAPPDWAQDLDNELSQLIRIHQIMNAPDYTTKYPKPVRRAIDVAYASHFRALTEFFHDGRPKKQPQASDLTYREVTGEPTPFRPYSAYAKQRLDDADKLVGHLSKLRRSRTSDWGSDQDWRLMWPMIQRLLKRPGTVGLLTETMAAISEAGLTPSRPDPTRRARRSTCAPDRRARAGAAMGTTARQSAHVGR
jgi:hypothetical protein